MLRLALRRIFGREFYWILYLAPLINIAVCYRILSDQAPGRSPASTVWLSVFVALALAAIALNLYRFVAILRDPYRASNLHIALSSIFSVITFFSVIDSLIFMVFPGAFNGMDAATAVDRTVNAVYFSIITFTTVGYGDIFPVHSWAKVSVSIETLSFFIFFAVLTSNRRTFFDVKNKGGAEGA